MSNQIQVGDVWHDEEDDIEYTVSKIHGNQVAFWYLKKDVLCVYTDYAEHMIKYMTLIERDGKPVRELENGAFYPVHIINAACQEAILRYIDGEFWTNQYFNVHNEYTGVRESELSWIGEKLDIKWPEVS